MNKYITTVEKTFIENKVKEILANRLGLKPEDIKKSSLLKDDLGIDSFDSLRIIFEVEGEFSIKVPPSDVTGIKTVNDIVNYILKRLKKISN